MKDFVTLKQGGKTSSCDDRIHVFFLLYISWATIRWRSLSQDYPKNFGKTCSVERARLVRPVRMILKHLDPYSNLDTGSFGIMSAWCWSRTVQIGEYISGLSHRFCWFHTCRPQVWCWFRVGKLVSQEQAGILFFYKSTKCGVDMMNWMAMKYTSRKVSRDMASGAFSKCRGWSSSVSIHHLEPQPSWCTADREKGQT